MRSALLFPALFVQRRNPLDAQDQQNGNQGRHVVREQVSPEHRVIKQRVLGGEDKDIPQQPDAQNAQYHGDGGSPQPDERALHRHADAEPDHRVGVNMQRSVGDVKHLRLAGEQHGQVRRGGHDHRDDEHRRDGRGDAPDEAGALRLLRLVRPDVDAYHGGHGRAEGRGQIEAYGGDIVRDPLPVQDDGAVFLRFVVDQEEADVQHQAHQHGGDSDPHDFPNQLLIELVAFQRELVLALQDEQLDEHPYADQDV